MIGAVKEKEHSSDCSSQKEITAPQVVSTPQKKNKVVPATPSPVPNPPAFTPQRKKKPYRVDKEESPKWLS